MTKQHLKWILLGTVVIGGIVSAGYLWLTSQRQPMSCTINQIYGDVIVLDETTNNAIICTKPNYSVILRLHIYGRVGGVWHISKSPGLLVSDGRNEMLDPPYIGFGTEEWNVTIISPGIQTLSAKCIQGVVGEGQGKLISTQNLTFVAN